MLVLAAAEAVIGLALALALFRRKAVPDVDRRGGARMMPLLAWAWLFTLPGLVLTAAGCTGRSERARATPACPGPSSCCSSWPWRAAQRRLGDRSQFDNWLPFLPDGAFRAAGRRAQRAHAGHPRLRRHAGLPLLARLHGRRPRAGAASSSTSTCSSPRWPLLVLAGNLAVLLIGWTGVGISSFLLISFWRDRPGTLGAGLQALAANAIGDGALLLAAVDRAEPAAARWSRWARPQCTRGSGRRRVPGTAAVHRRRRQVGPGPAVLLAAQRHGRPDPDQRPDPRRDHGRRRRLPAGAHPRPAGAGAADVSLAIAIIGIATALAASVASLFQSNFKKGIAYSTVAQLGYMFAAVGVGAPFAGLFHLFTHASFKALLFLAAGIVIHGAGGRESLWSTCAAWAASFRTAAGVFSSARWR